jgi:hypothetical protein
MEDPILNRNLEETRELQQRWSQFRDFVTAAMRGQKISSQAEMKFLELKSRIAMLHDGFMGGLQHDQKTGMNIMNIVADCILLGRLNQATDAERQKFEFDWNECYLLLTEAVGLMEEEQKRLAGISMRAHKAAQRRERMKAALHNFAHGVYLKIIVAAFVFFMVVWGVPTFQIYDYRQLGVMEWSRPAYEFYTNNAHRKFFDKDLEFLRFEALPFNETHKPEDNPAIKKLDAKDMTLKYFRSTVLRQLGYGDKDVKEADDLLNRLNRFEAYHYSADAKDVQIYAIMFTGTPDAKKFCAISKDVFERLPAANRKAISDNVFMTRHANFVALGISQHIMREAFMNERWMLEISKYPNVFGL